MACELSYINTAILVTFALQLSKSRQAVYTKWSIKSGQNHNYNRTAAFTVERRFFAADKHYQL